MNKKDTIKKFVSLVGILFTIVTLIVGCGKQTTETKPYNEHEQIASSDEEKYIGEVYTSDANIKNPSYASTIYSVSLSDYKIKKIEAEINYKDKNTERITINNINVTSEDVAAGTSYVEFNFEGESAQGKKYTGTGVYSYSKITDDNEICLQMDYNEDLFSGVNISTGYRIRLGLNNLIVNEHN